jgi:glycosyltransferase involved in cell wall biosynthesis
MKVSVLIVAHNEERNIRACLTSIVEQSLTPDEIVVICHNCTDATEDIARSFSNVRVIAFSGPGGVPYARIKGFEIVTGDIVACLDGDSRAGAAWLLNITRPLLEKEDTTLVGGYVVLTNNLYSRLISFWQFVVLRRILKHEINYFVWGSNFACRKVDYKRVGGVEPLIKLKEQLGLNFWAEDYYLSCALKEVGAVEFALNAKSFTKIPQWKVDLATAPQKQWSQDNKKLLEYFREKREQD